MPNQSVPTRNPALTALLSRFRTVRADTLAFVAPLSPEDMMVQSSPDASPVKWHLAHTTWFFETFLLTPFGPAYKPFNPDFHWLFNSYYNSLGDMPAKNLRASFSRPPLDAILAYRAQVDNALARLLDSDLADDPEREAEILRRVALGLEHEQQHLELAATDIKHALFTNPLHPVYNSAPTTHYPLTTNHCSFTSFPGGLVEIGLTPDPSDPLAFAFDNETPRHQVFLQPFSLANRLVTVAEYLAFIDDNGYSRPELWLSEGWTTMRAGTEGNAWEAPLYWTRSKSAESGWSIYTLTGFRPLDDLASTPVCHLSFFEADAFARWSSCRLPTEFEWEHAAKSAPTQMSLPPQGVPHDYREAQPNGYRGNTHLSTPGNFLESGSLHPSPAPAETPQNLQQLFGDVWEWTASPYTGYPGYKPLPGALGEYNGKFMSSQIILRGGSCVTPADHIRPTYRNFFPPSTRWQFAGLRLAR